MLSISVLLRKWEWAKKNTGQSAKKTAIYNWEHRALQMTLYNSCYRPFLNKNLSLVLMITFTTESKRSDLKSFGKY